MKECKLLLLIAVFIFILCKPLSVFAIVNPLDSANNKFGIHLAVPDEADLKSAQKLVNSTDGDWGYVTLVIQENDRDRGKWQGVFDNLRKMHLIPIIRLATSPEGEVWRRPTKEDAGAWLSFLNSLNWVIENRYITLFNEPNHAAEWGGAVNPEDYAEVSYNFAKELKKSNPDYFIMLAGIDQAAPTIASQYLDESQFFNRFFNKIEASKWEKLLDGLCSHAYPNPAFSGSPYSTGRQTIRGYVWEKELLQSLGLNKDLPVFIVETGWKRGNLDEKTVAEYYKTAFSEVWLPDSQVVMVSPFILNYQGDPFLDFSFQKKDSSEFYEQFEVIRNIKKNKGNPKQITKFQLLIDLPKELVASSEYLLKLRAKNIGQSIWQSADYSFGLASDSQFEVKFAEISETYPGSETDLYMKLKTPFSDKELKEKILVYKNRESVSEPVFWQIKLYANMNLEINFSLLFGNSSAKNFQVEIYDKDEKLVHKQSNLDGKQGKIIAQNIRNVIVNDEYRIVLVKKGYLPRQTYVKISKKTIAKMESMLPLDFNHDGKLSLADLTFGLIKP